VEISFANSAFFGFMLLFDIPFAIIAAILIPLTLVAGIYGMNFRYMPELEWVLGYPFVLLIMLTAGIVMLFYFRRRKWM